MFSKIKVFLLLIILYFIGFSISQCPVGYYGSTCESTCGQCAGNGSCSQITGYCYGGCRPGYTGSKCEGACPSTCGGDGSCRQYPPYCIDGCQTGYTGLRCELVSSCPVNCMKPCGSYGCTSGCMPGYFGLNCSFQCDCPLGVACQQDSGVCEATMYNNSSSLPTNTGTVSSVATATKAVLKSTATIHTVMKITTATTVPKNISTWTTTGATKKTAATNETLKTLKTTAATDEVTEKITATTRAADKMIATFGEEGKSVAATSGKTENTTQSTVTTERILATTVQTKVATTEPTKKTMALATFRATSTAAKTTTQAAYGTYIVIHYVDETEANAVSNSGSTTLPTMASVSESFYTVIFWIPSAVLGIVAAIACTKSIWLQCNRKIKKDFASYESQFIVSKEVNMAYDRLNELQDHIYLEVDRMSSAASFPRNGGGSLYYSTANLRSDNRTRADPAFPGEGVKPDGQPERISEAHAYVYLIP